MGHVFSESAYLSLGDPYLKDDKKKKRDEKPDLKQFTTSPGKKGFPYQNYKSLYEKEPYFDPGHHERKLAKEKRSKITVPFKPSSPPKRPVGAGSVYGTISGKYDHMPEYDVVKKGDKPRKSEPQKKNILTSNPKRGTYGFSGLGISKDYQRIPNVVDDYEAMRKQAQKESKSSKEKMRGSFRAGRTHRNEFFDDNPYKEPATLPKSSQKKAAKEEKKVAVPFKPSSPPKRGGTIGKYPQYISEPYEAKPTKKKDDKPTPVWRAVSTTKIGPTRSVLFGDK